MAVKAETNINPSELLPILKTIEKEMDGRRRALGPRLIDLDLLFYDDLVISCDELAIPHPLLHKRDSCCFRWLRLREFVHPV